MKTPEETAAEQLGAELVLRRCGLTEQDNRRLRSLIETKKLESAAVWRAHEAQFTKLQNELAKARALLTDAANTFRTYERLHRAKGTQEGDMKATANAREAETIEKFLRP